MICDVELEMQGILIKSVDDNQLEGAVEAPRRLAAIEESLHSPEEGDDSTLIKLVRTNNVVMSLGWADSGHQYLLGTH